MYLLDIISEIVYISFKDIFKYINHNCSVDNGTTYISHKMPHFLGKCSGNLFLSKGIRRVGVELGNHLYRVPIPQNATFSMEV